MHVSDIPALIWIFSYPGVLCQMKANYFAGGESIDGKRLQDMRELVAKEIKSNPDQYNEAVLERSNSSYCDWILKDTSWGGGIELSVFSQYYEIEIVALDLKTGILNR